MILKLENTTGFKADVIRQVVRFCIPKNLKADFTLRVTGRSRVVEHGTVKQGEQPPAGAKIVKPKSHQVVATGHQLWERKGGSCVGRYYHTTPPHIIVRVSETGWPAIIKPYQYQQNKGKEHFIASRLEGLVYLMAHELRHLGQQYGRYQKAYLFPLGYAHNSRGVFSEVDTEAYAIHTLRRWRKENLRTLRSGPIPVSKPRVAVAPAVISHGGSHATAMPRMALTSSTAPSAKRQHSEQP
jgi:hypothetical protein